MKNNISLLTFLGIVSISTYVNFGFGSAFANAESTTSLQSQAILVAVLDCKEWKKRNGATGKAAADDAPSWVINEGHKPCKSPNEDGKTFAKRVLDGKYGAGNYPTGPASEYNKTQKYGDRSFE